jgi:hypothetical protein
MKLAEYNRAHLIWVPEHMKIEGNEITDRLSKPDFEDLFMGPETACDMLSYTTHKGVDEQNILGTATVNR